VRFIELDLLIQRLASVSSLLLSGEYSGTA
jgi:hypothetical protein